MRPVSTDGRGGGGGVRPAAAAEKRKGRGPNDACDSHAPVRACVCVWEPTVITEISATKLAVVFSGARFSTVQQSMLRVSRVPVSVKKSPLHTRIHVGILAFRAPNQGLESSFCCWTPRQGIVQKECFFTQTPV